jgi:hypothetical protein
MQQTTDAVYMSKEGWRALLRSAGLRIESERFFTFCPEDPEHDMLENHWLLVARRTEEAPLLGPYPYPHLVEGTQPERRCLDVCAWREFSGRLERDEVNGMVGKLVGDRRTLDISNGHHSGKSISQYNSRCPSKQLFSHVMLTGSAGLAVLPHIKGARAISSLDDLTKYVDNCFETVVGTWILDRVSDVTPTVEEMVRITDRSAAQPRIMLLQGAPWNEVLRFQNAICTPLAARSQAPSHQEYLLNAAIKVLSRHGFQQVTLSKVKVACSFPEEDLEGRCSKAAQILADLWHSNDANREKMRNALVPQLRLHFRSKPHEIGFDMVLLVAEPGGGQI